MSYAYACLFSDYILHLYVFVLLNFHLCSKVAALITSLRLRVRTTRVVAASSQNLVKPSPMSTFPFQLKSQGCCPDDFTTARGENKEGCGCYSTPNGCCPDKFTPSPGPDGKVKDGNCKLNLHNIPQGCPCNTHEFGCCPNGVSIARGPGQEGCTCKVTVSHFFLNQSSGHRIWLL